MPPNIEDKESKTLRRRAEGDADSGDLFLGLDISGGKGSGGGGAGVCFFVLAFFFGVIDECC